MKQTNVGLGCGVATIGLVLLFNVMFWGAIVFVVLHFLLKLW